MGDNKISEAVAWTVVGPDGENSIGGWLGMHTYEASLKWATLREGHRYEFAYRHGEAVPVGPKLYTEDGPCWHHDGKAFIVVVDGDTMQLMVCSGARIQFIGDALPFRIPAQPAELNEVSGNSGELPPEEVTLKQVIDGYVATYGSLRQAAELLCIDPAYLSRLAGCRKTNPSDEVLGKLGLERRVVYTRKVHDYQPTKLHQRTKYA